MLTFIKCYLVVGLITAIVLSIICVNSPESDDFE